MSTGKNAVQKEKPPNWRCFTGRKKSPADKSSPAEMNTGISNSQSVSADRPPEQLRNVGRPSSTIRRIVIVVIATGLILFFAYEFEHATQMAFVLTWFPGDSYVPARIFPEISPDGEPKIVLVRKNDSVECYEILYSRLLESALEKSPSREVNITYVVRFRFGRPYWIETVDVAGLGIRPTSSYDKFGQTGRGECFKQ
jgi:hypothetical protein